MTKWQVLRGTAAPVVPLGAIELRDYPAPLGSPVSLAVLTVPRRSSHGWSGARTSWRLYHVTVGGLAFSVAGEQLDMSAGDALFIPPGTRYRYRNVSEATDAEVVLCTSPPFDPDDEMEAEDSGERLTERW